jgi:DNA-binding NarL/FixJ family response regulator
MIGSSINGQPIEEPAPPLPNLSPRMQQTLQHLLAGDSEKQIAHQLGLSRNTVHVYVKALYRGFGVSSRGELLARFIQQPKFQSRRK